MPTWSTRRPWWYQCPADSEWQIDKRRLSRHDRRFVVGLRLVRQEGHARQRMHGHIDGSVFARRTPLGSRWVVCRLVLEEDEDHMLAVHLHRRGRAAFRVRVRILRLTWTAE